MGKFTVDITDANFEKEVATSGVPVLVDFWAEWCGPCRMIAPAVEGVAEEYTGKVKVGKVNVDENGETATRFNIRGIPTLLLFKDGKVVDQRVGAVGKGDIVKMITPHVA
jgi:thioredoxin 1